jgi:hypothetical protein
MNGRMGARAGGTQPELLTSQISGTCWVDQGDRRHGDGKVWEAGIVTGPEGDLVARSANDNRLVPTLD